MGLFLLDRPHWQGVAESECSAIELYLTVLELLVCSRQGGQALLAPSDTKEAPRSLSDCAARVRELVSSGGWGPETGPPTAAGCPMPWLVPSVLESMCDALEGGQKTQEAELSQASQLLNHALETPAQDAQPWSQQSSHAIGQPSASFSDVVSCQVVLAAVSAKLVKVWCHP